MITSKISMAMLGVLLLCSAPSRAEDYVLTLKDHQFSPANLAMPANQKIQLIVKNLGPDKAEFESSDLDREQVVDVNGQITVYLGPLDPGAYGYFDDFHRETTGTITAK